MNQSVVFDRTRWTRQEAERWLLCHGILPVKPAHSTGTHWRYRLAAPLPGAAYRTLSFGDQHGPHMVQFRAGAQGRGFLGDLKHRFLEALPPADETARPGFRGEHHAPLVLPNGRIGIGNFIGPGTHIAARVRRGDPPRTEVDRVARAHDIRYSLSADPRTQADADLAMLRAIDRAEELDADRAANIAIARYPIRAKYLAEKKGLVPYGFVASSGGVNRADRRVLANVLKREEALGYGL